VELTSRYNGSGGQLWLLDQLSDGSYRIVNKAVKKCLIRNADGTLELTPFIGDDDQRWLITSP
jgi:hypothetical protein